MNRKHLFSYRLRTAVPGCIMSAALMICLFVTSPSVLYGQIVPGPAPLDLYRYPPDVSHEVFGLSSHIYEGDWYDRCPTYQDPPPFLTDRMYFRHKRYKTKRKDAMVANVVRIGDSVRIGGLTVLTRDWEREHPIAGYLTLSWYFSETMLLYKGTPESGLTFVDSVQWDTATPYRVILPRNAQSQPGDGGDHFFYSLAYDAYFSEPVTLGGVYTIASTQRNNRVVEDTVVIVLDSMGNRDSIRVDNYYFGLPTEFDLFYEYIIGETSCWPCIQDKMHRLYAYNHIGTNEWLFLDSNLWGPFLPIVDTSHTPSGPVDPPVGVGEAPDGGLQFTLTPNPARGSVTVAATEAGRYNVTIYDASGHRVVSFPFEGRETRIDIRALPAGHYILTLDSPSLSGSRGFVKN